MVIISKRTVAGRGMNIRFTDNITSCIATREVNLQGPCVVSGVQSDHAEEIVFVRSGSVEARDGDGNVFEGRDNFISLLQGQRYHLHVNAGETAKILIFSVPDLEDREKKSVLQSAKAHIRDMLRTENIC